MPRNLPAILKSAAMGESIGEAFVLLMEISHFTLPVPLRFTSDVVPVIIGSATYLPYPFVYDQPDVVSGGIPTPVLTIANVDLTILAQLRSFDTKPVINLSAAIASDPESEILPWVSFLPYDFDWDSKTISVYLSFKRLVQESFTRCYIDPEHCPMAFLKKEDTPV